jgi:hypothetical protein
LFWAVALVRMLPTLDFGKPITKMNELKTILLENDMDKLCCSCAVDYRSSRPLQQAPKCPEKRQKGRVGVS